MKKPRKKSKPKTEEPVEAVIPEPEEAPEEAEAVSAKPVMYDDDSKLE